MTIVLIGAIVRKQEQTLLVLVEEEEMMGKVKLIEIRREEQVM